MVNFHFDKRKSVKTKILSFADTIVTSTESLIHSSETVHKSALSLNHMADMSLQTISRFKLQDENGVTDRNKGLK
ncbi:hypothetical protein [uncultured Clostridium sp.]|uniref:hypothetical protein n=1 Tax=uncultured Clostridium sp. TaxID=59620 RepID=UPI00262D36AF|nr:hypothetical protein [uncultured Clostridium sp.]